MPEPKPTPAPHRLRLSAAEYAYLVDRLELSMPPGWEPEPDAGSGAEPSDLAKRGVLRGDGDLLAVHPSVEMNLRILAGPRVMLDTTTTIGTSGLHSLHAVNGALGASLFTLEDGAVEISMFAATDLGRELIRAVPSELDTGIESLLGNGNGHPGGELRGRVPLAALHELGVAQLLRGADPDAPAEVLAELSLPAGEAELARRVAARTNGALLCMITARIGDAVRSGQVTWLHAGAEWVGIRPDPDASGRRMVSLEPVDRADLGVWAAPYVAEALSDG
jgi:hypothetical protein